MVSNIISQERLTKYLKAVGFHESRALALYGWNIQISESFYPVLSASEVCLRNTISERLTELYGERWWESREFLDQIGRGKRIVKTAQDKLKKTGTVTSGRMTAELNFGFWVNMLLEKHEPVFWTDFPKPFYSLPATVSYLELFERCDSVREFRNRIFHHEPIFERDISFEFRNIMQLIEWLSPEKSIWIKPYSRVMSVLRDKP